MKPVQWPEPEADQRPQPPAEADNPPASPPPPRYVDSCRPQQDPDAPLPGSAAARSMEAKEQPELPRRQLVFLVRHAQSRWNKAQEEMKLLDMMSENDHGLSGEGRVQAEKLRQRIEAAKADLNAAKLPEDKWMRHFLEPEVVFSSPFTRSVSTACIGLRDLLPGGNQLVLMKEAREQKNIGGVDSTGVAVGAEIPVRVQADMELIYEETEPEEREKALAAFQSVVMDATGVEEQWWGGLTGDSEDLIHERIRELVGRLRTTHGNLPGGGGTAIVVGHSLFIRTLFRNFLREPDSVWERVDEPSVQVAMSLTTHVLPFCGVVGCLFEWDQDGVASIVEAVPFLDTSLRAADLAGMLGEGARSWPPPPTPSGAAKGYSLLCSRSGMDSCSVQ